jgi:calcineurin-like phosphoesterase family protein
MRLNIDLINNKHDVFFTSDFHLFHKNIIRFDNRPFSDVKEMHKTLLQNWNRVVNENDVVIYLGDLAFTKKHEEREVKDFLDNLNGKIHYVLGNHDKYGDILKMSRFTSVTDYLEVKISHYKDGKMLQDLFCCMHYPIFSWNKGHHGSIMVHGHTHMSLSDGEFHKTRRIIDVACNGHDYIPISYKEILERMNKIDYKISTKHH